MPTIDQLAQAAAAADTDEMLVSQAGTARKATRAQIVAGLQPQLALSAGQLLGRVSSGSGGPEPIAVGANLSVVGGVLSAAAAPFSVPALPVGASPAATDTVALGQAGASVAVPYQQFMAAMAQLPGFDVSRLGVTATGVTASRRLADIAADAIAVEAFGAKGDGATDDSAALAAAIASGRPVRLGSKTYVVNGQFVIATPNAVLLGTPGQTILKRAVQTGGGAWISLQADGFRADGITFDANKAAVSQDSWGVLVTTLCTRADFFRCTFQNAAGATLGSGLTFLAADPALSNHVVRDCEFAANAVHGVWVQACQGVLLEGCRAHDNGGYGINVDFNDATFAQKVHLVQVLGCTAWNNVRGIAVGNFNVTNTSPPVWGNANPDANAVVVANNICHDNTLYGIAVSGRALSVQDNLVSNNGTAPGGGGILANVANSRIAGNMVLGGATYGIDCGGSINSDISGNAIDGAVLGIVCGGSTNLRVADNLVQNCANWAVSVNNVETDGQGLNFNLACSNVAITGNWISLPTASAGGIQLRDGPRNILVARNDFVGGTAANVANCLYPATDSVIVEGNRWNFTQRAIVNPYANGAAQQITYPDILDSLMVTFAPSGVQTMITASQSSSYGQLAFVKITAGGANYTRAAIAVGGAGSGAVATPYISNGAIIGVFVAQPGANYGGLGTTWPVVITGDGTGAAGTAFAGIPLADERRLTVRCNCAVLFTRAGSNPLQDNWTGYDLYAPANSDVTWTATYGQWRAADAAPSAYITADGSGGTLVRSPLNGDVALHPNGTGRIRLTSDAEPYGCFSTIGRGAPEGVVTAPQGSDYRNLNGGVGNTLWIKRSGAGNTGWFAIA